jgi:PAS domain S-box-containing protein
LSPPGGLQGAPRSRQDDNDSPPDTVDAGNVAEKGAERGAEKVAQNDPEPDPSGDAASMAAAFRCVFESSPCGMFIVDDAGRIVMANPKAAEVLGHPLPSLAGRPLQGLFPERHHAGQAASMAQCRATGAARLAGCGQELTALHADGSELPVEVTLSRVPWAQQQRMTLAVVGDVGIHRQLEHELRQANHDLQEFTYVASHDLRSPLRGIADLVEWIAADLGESVPPEVARNLGRIGQRIERMERLIDDLLRYARASRAATELAPVDLGSVVADILEIQPLPAGFTLDLALDVEPFQGPLTPIATVLRNLIANAVKHHDRPAGSLRVAAEADGGFCVVSVTDDGPGVPEAARERIFKLFQTLTASERAGAGVGLALSKRLVEVHGGSIDVLSPVAEGRGATFRFRWPRFPRRTGDA